MAVSAFSEAARSADGQLWHREHHQPAGPLRVRPSPPAVWADALHSSPGFILPAAEAERFAAAVPSARVVEIDANHYTITTQNDSIAAIGAFLKCQVRTPKIQRI